MLLLEPSIKYTPLSNLGFTEDLDTNLGIVKILSENRNKYYDKYFEYAERIKASNLETFNKMETDERLWCLPDIVEATFEIYTIYTTPKKRKKLDDLKGVEVLEFRIKLSKLTSEFDAFLEYLQEYGLKEVDIFPKEFLSRVSFIKIMEKTFHLKNKEI